MPAQVVYEEMAAPPYSVAEATSQAAADAETGVVYDNAGQRPPTVSGTPSGVAGAINPALRGQITVWVVAYVVLYLLIGYWLFEAHHHAKREEE